MKSMVDDLLDAARLSTGKLRIRTGRCDVGELIADVCRSMAHRAAEDGHVLSCEADEGLPAAEGDPVRLRQVVTNLVDNAIKFSPPRTCTSCSTSACPGAAAGRCSNAWATSRA
jgi:signal transduction histidine kinase